MAVFIEFKFNESFIIWLFIPKHKLDPPTRIILDDSTFANRESFFISAKSSDFDVSGVAGKRRGKQHSTIAKHIKAIVLIINFLILLISQN
jgi:hypothetical protein